ncbi:hypothetical protein [Nakamurella aerolata]|uniref:Uncharacterized protein n=1 Tax=Nakamurella aerolata TaxID=1656892 RepID=A0A849A7I3_9ACTN|nr:hypothetical protein [Nakamurella aerolata]NNG35443.1 hypothetical protein [Nakamurella aerolata]
MTSGFFGGSGGSPGGGFGGFGRRGRPSVDLSAVQRAMDGAAQALIDLDTRQNYVDEAIRSLKDLRAPAAADLASGWTPVAQRSFEASAQYMDAVAQYPLTDAFGEPNAGLNVETARRAFTTAHRAMTDAANAVDSFYQRHRDQVESAKRTLALLPQRIGEAKQAATAATTRAAELGEKQPALLDYTSVSGAIDQLSGAMAVLNAAGAPSEQAAAAEQVTSAAAALDAAVQAAPELAGRVRSTLPSLRTRLDSLATRMHRLPEAQSTMWREFSQANSVDLNDHGRLADAELAAARSSFADAERLAGSGDAEGADRAIAATREHAGRADDLLEAVTDRLAALRAVKADRQSAIGPTRFAIRDAQRLVVARGLESEWASVLDAQAARVDRAVQAWDRPHPNYWAGLQELTSVREFVADIVDRIRTAAREG